MDQPPLVVHLTHALSFGGLESLLVERINRMPAGAYRHAVICLTRSNPDFARKIRREGVQIVELHKPAGLALSTHAALYRALRRLRPTVLHAYNLAAVEYGPVALLAGVPVRVHGSHGRDAADPHGLNPKHNALRRAMVPFYDCCYANSGAMLDWLRATIKVSDEKSCLLSNGIDADRFRAKDGPDEEGAPIVIGTVGRVEQVKNHAALLDAFLLLRERQPQLRERLRLAIIGDGPVLNQLRARAADAGVADAVWLPGTRTDVADILRTFRVFAMSSIAEGTPGAALEAMATALPVVGTRVGGIPEVIEDGVTGTLVPPSDPAALAAALEPFVLDAAHAARVGTAGRERVLRKYSMGAMVAAYQSLYDTLCERKTPLRKPAKSCVE
ncbi:glycosyltransferase [Massilia arenosa]|uniref:Glycosyltransferase n=2 Tax=Zemynaea arenosa TaxID=2561931 RepID=A0A4Y9SVZ8_9BURK|nr:glycosyltransferase [Massilia arenosa]